jgi:hypothetical protein
MSRKVAVYGDYKAKVPVYRRYWKRRKDGIKQRYRKRTRQTKWAEGPGRYEFRGKGKDLYGAMRKATRIVPKGFVDVAAEKFLTHPEKYGYEGYWIEREVESG